jgi:hypothetical protein
MEDDVEYLLTTVEFARRFRVSVKRKAKEIREARPPMPAEDREQRRRAEQGERWQRCLYDLYMVLNSVRDAGGIERVAAACDGVGLEKFGGELCRITETLRGWTSYLRGERQ